MDKMLFQFIRIGFCDDIHTKQRRALFIFSLGCELRKQIMGEQYVFKDEISSI